MTRVTYVTVVNVSQRASLGMKKSARLCYEKRNIFTISYYSQPPPAPPTRVGWVQPLTRVAEGLGGRVQTPTPNSKCIGVAYNAREDAGNI